MAPWRRGADAHTDAAQLQMERQQRGEPLWPRPLYLLSTPLTVSGSQFIRCIGPLALTSAPPGAASRTVSLALQPESSCSIRETLHHLDSSRPPGPERGWGLIGRENVHNAPPGLIWV
ncbi:hypothetical protein EYF80_056246 [Liparis tanakae]|uniref:Uncharacterized protein n=1 Tax=Liparis tanakae TaxID=230148 RepID=A0A4Z2EYC9_9TELE|nr:hypothetical protein EYF80_056246 [Liparis tanakae]